MELWLPTTAKPKYVCRLCGTTFTEHENRSYERHALRCFKDREQEAMESSLARRAPGLAGDEGVDVEFEQWHKSSPKGLNRAS